MEHTYSRYTAYKLNMNGTLSHKENLDNMDEVSEWINKFNFANILLQSNNDVFKIAQSNGDTYNWSESFQLEDFYKVMYNYITK